MPLSKIYRARFESLSDRESLEEYLARVPLPKSDAEGHFLAHVLFDHFDNFAGRFRWFDYLSWAYEFRDVSADWVKENVRCEHDLSQWDHLYDGAVKDGGSLPDVMQRMKTWPIPPVIFELTARLPARKEYEPTLFPYHLIEGTHRVNYLRRLLEDGTIDAQSRHRLLVLRKK